MSAIAIPSPAELMRRMKELPADQRAQLDDFLRMAVPALWVPQSGPQSAAFASQADIVFYGGSAGGGKTDLLLGLALTEHERSIIFRREAVQLTGIEERMTDILGSRDGYNSQDGIWRLPEGRVMELGSVKEPGDWKKYQGRPHDMKGFDEVCHFTEGQFRALIGWMRTDNPNVRQRVVCAGNPPTDATGEWVKRYWAPWLDPNHPNPAKPGDLRWFVTNEKGEDQEVPGPEPVMVGDELVQPKSRTFIPSRVDDNLFLMATGYKAQLQALPEPLRSQMLRGDFNAGASDPVWQLIPTEWVKAAQARWKERDQKGPMTALGFDPSRGGQDKSSAARRHGQWFDRLVTAPGAVTKDGPTAAGFVVPLVRDGATIAVDSIGIGSSALDFLVGLGLNVHPVVGSESSSLMDKAGQLHFRNKRAEMYWRLREALDPTAPEPIALPPDSELLGDLTAPRYKVVTMGIAERSPCGVAAVLPMGQQLIERILGRFVRDELLDGIDVAAEACRQGERGQNPSPLSKAHKTSSFVGNEMSCFPARTRREGIQK